MTDQQGVLLAPDRPEACLVADLTSRVYYGTGQSWRLSWGLFKKASIRGGPQMVNEQHGLVELERAHGRLEAIPDVWKIGLIDRGHHGTDQSCRSPKVNGKWYAAASVRLSHQGAG